MPSLTLISEVEFGDEGVVLDCDLNGQGRLCSLIQLSDDSSIVRLDSDQRPIPSDWMSHVRHIRWLGDNEVVVWPIAPFSSSLSYIGVMSASGASAIESAFPLDVFADRNLLAATFSEEFTRIDVPKDQQSDLISLFRCNPNTKLGRFVDVFAESFSEERFLEVTRGVIDGSVGGFWFTAYSTDLLWNFSFDCVVTARAGRLGCPAGDVLAICCKDETATVVTGVGGHFVARTYLRTKDAVVFQSESILSAPVDLKEKLHSATSNRGSRIAGLRNNHFVLVTSSRATLINI